MSNLKNHLEKIQKEEAAANFAKWIRKDAILDDNDEPKVLYAGTLSDFGEFDITHTRPEAYFGQGFYFSDNLDDASDNYARREGPDHILNTDNEKDKLNNDLENFLEAHYKEELENPDDSEFNQKIKNIYDLTMDGEDIDDELLDELFEFHDKEKLKRSHEGFVMPVFLVARKLMDVDNHTFEAEEDYGDFNDLIQHFKENFSDISYDFTIELESLLSCPDDESYPDLEEVLGLLDSAIESSCIDAEDELEKIEEMKAYIENYYEIDDERCLTYKLSGEGPALRDTIITILENNGCESDASRFRESFNSNFSELESTFTALDFLENEDIQMALCDSYVEVDNIYNMHVSGTKALFAMAIQKMGYDTIKMDPSERFKEMNHVVGTTHYISFNPLNIKSAIGNNGEYSLTDPDILHRVFKNAHDINVKERAISFHEASHIIKDIGLHYKNMPKCEIHTNFDDVIHSIVGKVKNIESCTGWFDTHSHSLHVYLPHIMNRQEPEKTISHEFFGHLETSWVTTMREP